MDNTFTLFASGQLPRLAELLGEGSLQARDQEFERLHPACPWQVERDLELLPRYVPWAKITSAYRNLLRNPDQFIDAMYEIRVAAMLAPFVDNLVLAPRIGSGRCDLKCTIRGEEVFVEVTTHTDKSPPAYDGNVYGRATVEKSFDLTSKGDDPSIRATPASKELRDRILDEISQLPSGELTILVVGAPESRSDYMKWAIGGDECVRANEGGWWPERMPNGLFTVPDDVGGTSRLSALVWMKLSRHFSDVRVHSRLFTNPRAARPLPPEAEEVFGRVFDRRESLLRELERIKRVLLEQYHPERIILFGSLAGDFRPGGAERPDAVHEWSDIDLAIVKSTPLRFMDRIREVMDLIEPRVGLNVIVYTPEEFARAEQEGHFFVRDEILKKGMVLFP
jgi:predicted nucleotidyltransferase